jgi:hypothetical protein
MKMNSMPFGFQVFSEPVSIEDGDVIPLNQAVLNTQNVSGLVVGLPKVKAPTL